MSDQPDPKASPKDDGPSATTTSSSSPDTFNPSQVSRPSPNAKQATLDPLFGATPIDPSSSTSTASSSTIDQSNETLSSINIRARLEAGSRDRVQSLKSARDAALSPPSQYPQVSDSPHKYRPHDME
jgi:hypothetical protein